MKCSSCGCPGAYVLFRGVICWNRCCRNFHQDVIGGSDWSTDNKCVNGDPVEDVKAFITDVGGDFFDV